MPVPSTSRTTARAAAMIRKIRMGRLFDSIARSWCVKKADRTATCPHRGIVAAQSVVLVPTVGLEPTRLAALAPQASVSTNSTTSATSQTARHRAPPHFGAGAGDGVEAGTGAGVPAGAEAGGGAGLPAAGSGLPLAASSRMVLGASAVVRVPI